MRRVWKIAVLAGVALSAPGAKAQSLRDTLQDQKIVQHHKQESTVRLLPTETPTQSYRYRPTDTMFLPGTGTYDAKPACSESSVRRVPVLLSSKELKQFDMTFYDYKNKAEVQRAKNFIAPTVPYIEGDVYNPFRDTRNLQQDLARFYQIRCLPTRVFYVIRDGQRFEEHREGALAWEPIHSNFQE